MRHRSGISGPVLAVVGLLLVAGCGAPGPQVQSFSDASVNFGQFQTFGFHSPLGTDRDGYQTVLSQQLMAATRREMEARGFRYQETDAQLLLNFGTSIDERLQVTTVPAPTTSAWGSPWGWRGGFYQPWPTQPMNETRVTQYQQGTLTIDLVNPATRQLVWEGVVTGRMSENAIRNPAAAVDNAVTAAFAEFPVPRTG